MHYHISIADKALKFLTKLSQGQKSKIIDAIEALKDNPRPFTCKKLKGNSKPPHYRIRVGNYRVIYQIRDKTLIILVLNIGHRKDVYN